MSLAHYELCSKLSPMYELCSYYDNGFIIDELMLYLIMYDLYHDPKFEGAVITPMPAPTR